MSDTIYTVLKGDTATKITKKFNISLDVFKKLNPTIKDVNKLSIGQKVKVGEEVVEEVEVFNENNYYFVKSGDTLSQIIELFDITMSEIQRLNPDITDINKIYIGQKVKVGEDQVFESSVQFFDKTNKPLINTPYIIYLNNGVQFFGISDEKGFSDLIITDYQINISDMEFPIELKESVYEW